jgi:hypothetical protein
MKKYLTFNNLLNVLAVAGPVLAGVLTGPAGLALATLGSIAAKLAATPLEHKKPDETPPGA